MSDASPNLVVRAAIEDDLELLPPVDGGSERSEVHESAIEAGRLLVASIDEAVVGYLRFTKDFPWESRGVFVQSVEVAEDARRQGVATALFATVEALAKSDGYNVLYSSHAAFNKRSRLMHRQLGFKAIGAFRLPDQPQPEVLRGKLLISKRELLKSWWEVWKSTR